MIKVYKKLTTEQKKRGVIFSSCLSEFKTEQTNELIHEIFKINPSDFENKPSFELFKAINENGEKEKRLLDDKFFNRSHFKFNVVRR